MVQCGGTLTPYLHQERACEDMMFISVLHRSIGMEGAIVFSSLFDI
jgi:hypothetical protein